MKVLDHEKLEVYARARNRNRHRNRNRTRPFAGKHKKNREQRTMLPPDSLRRDEPVNTRASYPPAYPDPLRRTKTSVLPHAHAS